MQIEHNFVLANVPATVLQGRVPGCNEEVAKIDRIRYMPSLPSKVTCADQTLQNAAAMCRGQAVVILGLLVGRACTAAPPKTSTPRVHAVKPQRSKPERHQRGVQHRFSKMPRHTTHPDQRVAPPAVNQSSIVLVFRQAALSQQHPTKRSL